MDINKILTKNLDKIKRIALKYHYNYDLDDFTQELLIECWRFLSISYDRAKSNNPEAYLVIYLNTLAKRVLKRFNSDKSLQLNLKMCELIDAPYDDHYIDDIDLESIIENELTDMEKKIVYSIDSYGREPKLFYSHLAEVLEISPQTLYYHIKNIRKKLKAVKNS